MEDPLIGRIVAGRYRVEQRLGQGAMGAVYRARHVATGGELALKFLHGQAVDDEVVVKRFTLEAQNAARLQHPGTVRIIDFGNDRGILYMAMELVPGETLAEVIAREAPLPWRRAVAIARQVLDALRAAHEDARAIVHRDVKPGNVMLVAHGGAGDVVKLLDFGVSRALAGTGAGTAGNIGTPYYMAPEVWRGEPADARADLYAVGAVLFELLTGRPPFVPEPEASTATGVLAALMRLHAEAPRPDPRGLAPDIPEPVARLVADLLAAAREERIPDARTALARIDALATRAVAAPRGGRRRLGIALGALALLTAIGIGVALAMRGRATPTVTFEQCLPANARSLPDTTPSGYAARLGDGDHTSADGTRITSAGRVVARDRERVHAGHGDPEDQPDTQFADAPERDMLAAAIDRTMATTRQRAILDGTPHIRVDYYVSRRDPSAGGLCVTLYDD